MDSLHDTEKGVYEATRRQNIFSNFKVSSNLNWNNLIFLKNILKTNFEMNTITIQARVSYSCTKVK